MDTRNYSLYFHILSRSTLCGTHNDIQGHPANLFGEPLLGRPVIAKIFGLKCDENDEKLEYSLAQIFVVWGK